MAIVSELKKGEKSKMVKNFDREEHLNKLHAKHLAALFMAERRSACSFFLLLSPEFFF